VPVFPLQGRQARRQDRHHLGRQQGREAHRRGDDRSVLLMRPLAAAALAALLCAAAAAQDKDVTQREVERYREMLAEGNPADLAEARGEELWKAKRGPNAVSLERCDLGLGRGVVKGAYAQLPRWFADTDRVQDLESRLVTCMATLQGFK